MFLRLTARAVGETHMIDSWNSQSMPLAVCSATSVGTMDTLGAEKQFVTQRFLL
jgi:hypothetical protein